MVLFPVLHLPMKTIWSNSATRNSNTAIVQKHTLTQATAQDLDVAGDSGTGAVDLDSEKLTIAGGTGLTAVVVTLLL